MSDDGISACLLVNVGGGGNEEEKDHNANANQVTSNDSPDKQPLQVITNMQEMKSNESLPNNSTQYQQNTSKLLQLNQQRFEDYLVQALNESLFKKSKFEFFPLILGILVDDIKCLRFESWWVENREKNQISVIFRLDGKPHEIIIKDTKYYVKEIYSGEKKSQGKALSCWDLYVGCYIDIFGKCTILKQCDLKTAEWN